MTDTRLLQLAIRGATEMPNDPYEAIQRIKLPPSAAMNQNAADRRQLAELAERSRSYGAWLVERYTA